MKKLFAYIFSLCAIAGLDAQYYLRGEVQDDKKLPLQNVKMLLHSNRMVYYSGSTGGFGISTSVLKDSITLSTDGFETKTVGVEADVFQSIYLKPLSLNASKYRQQLVSITRNQAQSYKFSWHVSDESYFSLIENEEVNASKFPNTAFSVNVNKASYSNIRRFLRMKSTVPPDAVRIEELLNYFNLHYQEPVGDAVFRLESQYSDCPWNEKSRLLFLNVSARRLDMSNVPPSNLVFLIDASGSMDMPNRLPLVKAAFQMLVKNLRAIDTVSIVTYGGTVAVWLPPTSGSEKQKITQSIEELTAAGDTPGESAIRLAYNIAERSFIQGGNNRVILATDGDFNVGETTEKSLEELITRERQTGVYLTCLGVGMGNFKDSKLETLAKRGNGNYAYLDDIREAEKVLVKEVTQTFFSVAGDVYLNVHFDPEIIQQYRLIGFDNKRDAIADTTIDFEGGEVGSGNSVMAIFEVVPQVTTRIGESNTKPLARVSLNYLPINEKNRSELLHECNGTFTSFNSLHKDYQLATAIAMFGMRLRESRFLRKSDWNHIESIALTAYNAADYLQSEFIKLVAIAKKTYPRLKKKKRLFK